jgi:hypothetical protein
MIGCQLITYFIKLLPSDEITDQDQLTKYLLERSPAPGGLLTPPIGDMARIAELGELTKHDVFVEGIDYKQSHMDVAIAGLG